MSSTTSPRLELAHGRNLSWRDRATAAAPWLVLLFATIWVLVGSGVAGGDILRFSLYWVGAVAWPGLLVHRALRGPRSVFAQELALGAVTGLALEIVGGVLLGFVGLDLVATWWWVAVYAFFLFVPSLRPFWRSGVAAETPAHSWSWSLAAIAGLALAGLVPGFRTAELPPAPSTTYQDLWWHLSLNNELLKPGAPQLPQVSGEPLSYHWFANLHMAIASQVSGVEAATVLLRLWFVPIVALTVVGVAILATNVSGVSWSGPLASWLTLLALSGGYLWTDRLPPSASPLSFLSPSQMLANLFVVVASIGLIELCRKSLGRADWVWLALVVIAASGVKPTVIPLLLAGTGAAAIAQSVIGRRIAWRPVIAGAGLLVLLVISLRFVAGSTSGTITVLGMLRGFADYRQLVGDDRLLATSPGPLLDTLTQPGAVTVAAVLIIWLAAALLPRLVGFAVLFRAGTRRDGAAWWLAGATATSWVAALVIDHAGLSQLYFLNTSAALGAVMTAWLLASVAFPGRLQATAVVIGLVFGAATAVGVRMSPTWFPGADSWGTLDRIVAPLLVAAICLGFLGGLGLALGRRLFARRATAWAVSVALVVGIAIPGSAQAVAQTMKTLREPVQEVDPDSALFVSDGEQEAALWLRDHSSLLDVVATNLHCIPPPTQPNCVARAFWLSGLSGRRVVLEGWGYAPETTDRHGVDGLHNSRQPSPWPDRLEYSQAAFGEPTHEILDVLSETYGARWLFGVRRAGGISPALESLATKVFDNGAVVIYRIP